MQKRKIVRVPKEVIEKLNLRTMSTSVLLKKNAELRQQIKDLKAEVTNLTKRLKRSSKSLSIRRIHNNEIYNKRKHN